MKPAEEVLDHMINYVEEKLHTSDNLHILGYLDTPHWVEAVTLYFKDQAEHILALKALAKQVDKRYKTDFHGDIEKALYPIFLVKHDGFDDYYSICTKIEQYSFDPQQPLFKYYNHIMVKRPVTYEEAKFLLEVIQHNGKGELCGGKAVEQEQL